MCHCKINDAKAAAREIQHKVSHLITTNEFSTLMKTISHQNQREEKRIRERHQRKLQRPDTSSDEKQREETMRRWVINISDHDLTPDEISLLRRWMNFAFTPKRVPVKEIITAVEQIFRETPKTRPAGDICNILKKSKPPKCLNISAEERRATKNLKMNEEILVLLADKGNATVIMNKIDYKKQISAMLQDTKTYSRLNDKRHNPTSSTANSLQRKLADLKKSGNLTDSEYCKIKPNDPVPAAFYGLPKIHNVQLAAKDDHYTLATPSTLIPLRSINSCIGSPTIMSPSIWQTCSHRSARTLAIL